MIKNTRSYKINITTIIRSSKIIKDDSDDEINNDSKLLREIRFNSDKELVKKLGLLKSYRTYKLFKNRFKIGYVKKFECEHEENSSNEEMKCSYLLKIQTNYNPAIKSYFEQSEHNHITNEDEIISTKLIRYYVEQNNNSTPKEIYYKILLDLGLGEGTEIEEKDAILSCIYIIDIIANQKSKHRFLIMYT